MIANWTTYEYTYIRVSQKSFITGDWFQHVLRRGALGCIRNRKTEEKIVQNRKTTKKFAQNRKPHTSSKLIRYTIITLTASFVPCIMLQKSDAGPAFSTVSQFTVNDTNMCYSLCYKRPLTDIVFFSRPSYRALNNDFGCRLQIKRRKDKTTSGILDYL